MTKTNLTSIERGCIDCGAGLRVGYDPDQKQKMRCAKCAAKHRAANLAAWEADKAARQVARARELISRGHYERADVLDATAAALLPVVQDAARCPEYGALLAKDGLCDVCMADDRDQT